MWSKFIDVSELWLIQSCIRWHKGFSSSGVWVNFHPSWWKLKKSLPSCSHVDQNVVHSFLSLYLPYPFCFLDFLLLLLFACFVFCFFKLSLNLTTEVQWCSISFFSHSPWSLTLSRPSGRALICLAHSSAALLQVLQSSRQKLSLPRTDVNVACFLKWKASKQSSEKLKLWRCKIMLKGINA